MDKNRLLGHMASNGYTQEALARELGVSKNTINAKINGKSAFDTLMIDAICKVLNITDNTEKAKIFLSNPSQKRDRGETLD